MSRIVTTYQVDEHTIEFGPNFPPKKHARAIWSAVSKKFYLDRFGGKRIWLGADWDRDGGWPCEERMIDERIIEVDGSDLHIASYPLVDAEFTTALLYDACYQWDGILSIAHDGTAAELDDHVRNWYDSIGQRQSFLRCACDAIYPVADGFGMRYTNTTKSIEALTEDVDRIIASVEDSNP